MNLTTLLFLFASIALLLCSCDDKLDLADSKSVLPKGPELVPEGMVWIPEGTYWRGNAKDPGNLSQILKGTRYPAERERVIKMHYREERPVHQVTVNSFFMDETEVTNQQFAEFVKATGYVTFAEKGLTQEDFPNANPEDLVAGANVYSKPSSPVKPWRAESSWRWWSYTKGANWRHPEGPNSTIEGKMLHPVVCVNYDDAAAYAKWAGKRLPTEAEWERAARGGKEKRMFIWGDNVKKNGEWMANCFQGNFPNTSTAEDGYHLTAPVKSFPPNDYGLYDMAGNVWEICSDYYNPLYYDKFAANPEPNPQGPTIPLIEREATQLLNSGRYDPVKDSHPLAYLRVIRGGSFLCHFSYCLRFRPAARHYHEPLTSAHHIGFRCVKDLSQPN